MKKKIIAGALILTMCMSALVGCGSKDKEVAGAKGEATRNVKVTLGIWPEETMTEDVAMYEEYKAKMEEKYSNVEIIPSYYKYSTDTFMPMAQSGNTPTIFSAWFTEPQKLIKANAVADITDLLQERGWLDVITPEIRELLSDENGRIYGLPRDAYTLGLMVNAKLFKDAGLVDSEGYPVYPKTWDELAQNAVTIKEKTGSAGLCLLAKNNAGGWHFSNIAWGFGANFNVAQEDGTYKANVNSKEAIAAMEYIHSLKWEYDVLTADPTNEDWGSGFTALATEDAAMYIAASDAVHQPTKANGMPLEDLGMGGLPAGPGGQFSLCGGTPYMFSKDATTEEINAALDFLEIIGKAPVVSDISKEGMIAEAKVKQETGIPIVRRFPCWTDQELINMELDVINEYKNVDEKMYDQYFESVLAGNLRTEEPGRTQDLYAELTKVLQAVLTDKDADIPALMDQANKNYQGILDSVK